MTNEWYDYNFIERMRQFRNSRIKKYYCITKNKTENFQYVNKFRSDFSPHFQDDSSFLFPSFKIENILIIKKEVSFLKFSKTNIFFCITLYNKTRLDEATHYNRKQDKARQNKSRKGKIRRYKIR